MRKTLPLVAALCFAVLAMAPTAVERSFLKIDGVDGESTDGGHAKWFQLASFS